MGRALFRLEGRRVRRVPRRAVRLICADPGGRRTGFRRGTPRSRNERRRLGRLLIAESRVPSREGRLHRRPSSRQRERSFTRGGRSPSRSRPARGRPRRRSSVRALAAPLACGDQTRCSRRWAYQAIATACGGLALLAALELAADARRVAVVPGGLDEQPPGVARARPGDRAEPAVVARGVLGGDQAEIARKLPGLGEAGEVADLRAQADRGSVSTPRRQRSRATSLAQGEDGDQLRDAGAPAPRGG